MEDKRESMEYNSSNAVSYHYGEFPPKKINYSQLINDVIKATESMARFDQMLKNLHNNEILLAPLRNQEALLSSRIEGTISTMDEILQYEADEKNENGKVRMDVIETVLYQRTLKNAQEALVDGYDISKGFIKQMHQQLLSRGRGAAKSPGEFKSQQNYLADKVKKKIQFIPIRPEKLEEGLDNLFTFLKESQEPPLIKTALMHLEFEALHPFQDGNGRIGRMLIPLYLWKEGILFQPHFYISGYLEENKEEYIHTMRKVSEEKNWEEWIRFFLKAITQQATKNLEIAESITTLYEDMKITFTDILSSKWSLIILEFLFTYPVFRNNALTKKTDIPNATATGITRKLLENGFLVQKEEASGSRSALYSFEPLMEIVRV